MISYENYENRIRRLAKFKEFVVKFKFLIIGVLAVILAAVTVILVIKGMVTSSLTIPESIIYGEDYSPEGATAIMSGVGYEYAPADGGEWSDEKPLKAGKYFVRAATVRAFGTKGHGDAVAFEIVPKDAYLTINDNSVVYGEKPADCTVTPLVYGDKLDISALQFEFADFASEETEVEVNLNSVRIYDINGGDSSGCYNLSADAKTIGLLERKLNVSPAPVTFTYAGKSIAFEPELSVSTLAGLAEGDEVVYETVLKDAGGQEVEAPQDAGAYTLEIVPESIKIFKGSVDVTARYGLDSGAATLSVERRPVTVTTASASKVFDTFALSAESYEQVGLIEGHSLVRVQQSALTITDAGSVANVYDYKITDENGSDVTANYIKKINYGTLTVSPKPVYVTTPSANKIYDGSPLYKYLAEESGLIQGYSLNLVSASELTDAGECENSLYFSVNDPAGKNATGNFELVYTYGKLTVAPRPVTITTESGSKVYDGSPLVKTAASVDVSTPLASGDRVVTQSAFSVTAAVQSAQNTTTYYVYRGNKNVTANYVISYIYGTLTVEKRPIDITTASNFSHIYDGAEFYDYGYSTCLAGGGAAGLIGGDTLTAVSYTKVVNALESVENVCVYTAGENYEIKGYTYGKLEIQPRPIVVQTASAEKYYDGTALSNSDYLTSYGGGAGLLNGDRLTLSGAAVQITEAGSAFNSCRYSVPNKNYEITGYTDGRLTVKPRPIVVYTESDGKEYDGTPLSNTKYTTCYYFDGLEDGLLNGDKLTLIAAYSVTNAFDNSRNRCVFAVPNGNYEIKEYSYGALIISARQITVLTATNSFIYDARTHYDYSYTTARSGGGAGLLNGDGLTVGQCSYVTDVGSKQNVCTYSVPNANYKITEIEYGTLTVTPRPIAVVTATDGTHIYDATAYSNADYSTYYFGSPATAGLLGGDTLNVVSYTSVTDAGNKQNVCKYTVGANYEIKGYDYGTLTVQPRPITVVTATDASHIYDATAYSNAGYSTHYYGEPSKAGLLGNDGLVSISYTERTDAGSEQNVCEYSVGANYEIKSYEYGALTVQPRPITVVTADGNKEYDGKPLSNGNYTTYYFSAPSKAGLLNGDTLELDGSPAQITNVWETADGNNKCAYLAGSNYKIQGYDYGTLSVYEKWLSVVPRDFTAVYGDAVLYPSGVDNYLVAYVEDIPVGGEKLEIEVYFQNSSRERVTPKDVGSYYVFVDQSGGKIYKNGVYDPRAIENYFLVPDDYGILEITPRPITVEVSDGYFTYGDIVENTEIYPSGENNFKNAATCGLQYGDTLEISVICTKDGAEVTPKNAGSYSICAVEGATLVNGKADTRNYEITYVDGTLTVAPKAISVKVGSLTLIYGQAIVYPSGENNFKNAATCGLEYGDTLEISVIYKSGGAEVSPKNAGSYSICAVEGATLINGRNDTSNYIISYTDGVLTINRKDITIELYDLPPVTYGESLTYPTGLNNFANSATCGLEYGEQLEVSVYYMFNGTRFLVAKDAGEYTVQYLYGYVYHDGGKYLTGAATNYNISCQDKTTRIYSKEIELKPESFVDLSYGQTPAYPATDGNYALVSGGTEYDDVIRIFISYYMDGVKVTPKNAGSYTVVIDENATLVNGVADTSNYDITYDTETFEILQKSITVELDSYTVTYGGAPAYPAHAGNFKNAAACGLEYGEALEVVSVTFTNTKEIPDAGAYGIIAGGAKIYNADGTAGSADNYLITFVDGTWTVTPRPIVIVTASAEKTYDGTPLSDGGYTTYFYGTPELAGLVNGDVLTLTGSPAEITNVWESAQHNNICAYSLPSANYVIKDYEYGTLSVNRRSFTLVLNAIDPVIYGDIPVYAGGIGNYRYITPNGLANGERLEVAIKYMLGNAEVTPKNAGIYDVYLNTASSVIYNASGEPIINGIENYAIAWAPHTATISRRQITVVPEAMSSVIYDGAYHLHNRRFSIASGELVAGESLSIGVSYFTDVQKTNSVAYPLNAGTYYVYTNSSACTITGGGAYLASTNYQITEGYVEFEIQKRALTVTLGDVSKVYDGEAYDFSAAPDSAFAVTGLCGGDELKRTVTYSADPVDAGGYYIYYDALSYALTVGTAENYFIDTNAGRLFCVLTVEKRKITVDVNYRSVEYTGNPVNPADESFVSLYIDGAAAGFVKNEETSAGAVYTYNGGTLLPTAKGKYELGVYFDNDAVAKNYDFVSIATNYLEITARKVGASPVFSDGTVYYNGESVSLSYFGFTSWHEVSSPASGDEYGFKDGDLAAITAEFTFTNTQNSSDIYKNGASPVNAGTYTVELGLSGYDTDAYFVIYHTFSFTIEKRPVTVTLGNLTHKYNNSSPAQIPDISNAYALDTTEAGILSKDLNKYAITHSFETAAGGAVTRYNAGSYKITANLNRLGGEDNYVIRNIVKGTLTITPATLYVKPIDKAEYYNGYNLKIAPTEYEIFGGDENGAFLLASGDYLFIEADKELAPTKGLTSISVARVWVKDAASANGLAGNDITFNYDIRTAYSSDMGEEYAKDDFKSQLEFLMRTVYYEQIVPAGQSSFFYTGSAIYIEYENASELFRDVTSGYGGMGLYGGHYLEVKSARTDKDVGVYTEWLTLKVLDGEGNDVTNAYMLKCVNGGASSVEVKQIELTLKISSYVTNSTLAGALTNSSYDGREVLDCSVYTLEGLPDGYGAEIVVEENGGAYAFKLLLFELRESFGTVSRKDREYCFNLVSVEKSSGLNATIIKSPIEEL